jgi:3-oxoacyl-[acyl-carrier protein] reductase
MDLSLKGRNALVCGSTQGIGFETAVALADLGANVTLLARNELALEEARAKLDIRLGQEHHFIAADFSFPPEVRLRVAEFLQVVGHFDILVNNTGGPAGGPILDARVEEFMQAFGNHLLCNHHLAQVCVPGMKKTGYGRIINVVSTSIRQPIPGLGVSNTTRGAVAGWAKTMAGELAPHNITVNNVMPGATMTARLETIIRKKSDKTGHTEDQVQQEMEREIPMGRVAHPREIAAVIAFLATPAASYVTGTSIPVDGGRTACI